MGEDSVLAPRWMFVIDGETVMEGEKPKIVLYTDEIFEED